MTVLVYRAVKSKGVILTTVNMFARALLDTVLAEYKTTDAMPDAMANAVTPHSVWVDKENRRLYFTRTPGCVQHLFPKQETLELFVDSLKREGYIRM